MTRTLDELGEPLFAGRTAEVYAWSDTEVIKLYQPWVSQETAERERASTHAALSMGISVPEVGEIVNVGERSGLILERIRGTTMMRQIESDISRAGSFARQLAEIHAAATGDLSEERRAMELFHTTYLDICVQKMNVDREEYAMWLPIVAAVRLSEGIPEFQDWLMEQVRCC